MVLHVDMRSVHHVTIPLHSHCLDLTAYQRALHANPIHAEV